MVCQLHRLLLELIPGGAKKALSAAQAKALLARVRPRDAAGKARRIVAAELISDLERIHQRKKAANKELNELLKATATTLTTLHGIGPSGAARLLVEVADVTRFPDKAHFASWNGTAPIDASSGDQVRHRLSRAGNRQSTGCCTSWPWSSSHRNSEGRAYYDRKVAAGKTPMEAMRSLKRRLVRHRLPPDDPRRPGGGNGPGRTRGGDYWLQRGRLAPQRRHFGEVTSRTRHPRRYARKATPFSWSFRQPSSAPDRTAVKRTLLDGGEDRGTLSSRK